MSEKKIKEAIDAIEPESGAKERMYQNIMKKAQQQAAPAVEPAEQKKRPMRLVRYALPIAACFCLLIAGASYFLPRSQQDSQEGGNVQTPNPITEVENADAFVSMGIHMDAPAGSTNVSYQIIDGQIACVEFDQGGHHFYLRASAQSGDFSGLYGTESEPQPVDAENNAVLSSVDIGTALCYRVFWTNGKINFYLFNTDGADSEMLMTIYYSIINK